MIEKHEGKYFDQGIGDAKVDGPGGKRIGFLIVEEAGGYKAGAGDVETRYCDYSAVVEGTWRVLYILVAYEIQDA